MESLEARDRKAGAAEGGEERGNRNAEQQEQEPRSQGEEEAAPELEAIGDGEIQRVLRARPARGLADLRVET